MAVNINVPSQVKTYANLAAFPATGALKTIYIAEDTNKTYRWTGSVYTEISASAAMTWGAIGGTLSNQTDLQSALDAKVPTSRTLTINGVTQDLSADRTFTISTGITIGSTAIASGVVGRVLFEGAGNVVQESGNLFWDNTNGMLGVGTSSPSNTFQVKSAAGYPIAFFSQNDLVNQGGIAIYQTQISSTAGNPLYLTATGTLFFESSGAEAGRFTSTTRNLLIGTTTDAGFRLDVNGTARVQGNAQFGTGFYWDNTNARLGIGTSTPLRAIDVFASSPEIATRIAGNGTGKFSFLGNAGGEVGAISLTGSSGEMRIFTANSYFPTFYSGGSEAMRIATTRNILINTTTDAGFRLDVNGTARVKATSTTGEIFTTQTSTGLEALVVYADRSSYIYGSNVSGYTTNIRIGGQANMANINFFGNNNIYVGQGGSTENIPSALIAMGSTNKGFLPPRMTQAQKNAIASPAAGLMVYDTTLNVISYYNGSMWI